MVLRVLSVCVAVAQLALAACGGGAVERVGDAGANTDAALAAVADSGIPADGGGTPVDLGSPDGGAPACNGNGACEPGERCDACPGDCGACTGGAPCARLNRAKDGELVAISGEMGDDPDGSKGISCDVVARARGVIVTGSWTGDVRCRGCTGWVFRDLVVTRGSLRMIAGDGWILRDSTFDGGGRGIMAVVGTGSVDGAGGQPTNWLIERIASRNAGCRPPNDPFPTHVRALYVIGKNGEPMNGVVRRSTFEGEGCGVTVKIGGTGNFGSWSGSPDAADRVTFEDNVVRNVGAGPEEEALLVATNSDDVIVRRNTLAAGEWALVASGPFSGLNLRIEDNRIEAPRFLLARVWNNPAAGALANLFGEKFLTFEMPGPCAGVAACSGNSR